MPEVINNPEQEVLEEQKRKPKPQPQLNVISKPNIPANLSVNARNQLEKSKLINPSNQLEKSKSDSKKPSFSQSKIEDEFDYYDTDPTLENILKADYYHGRMTAKSSKFPLSPRDWLEDIEMVKKDNIIMEKRVKWANKVKRRAEEENSAWFNVPVNLIPGLISGQLGEAVENPLRTLAQFIMGDYAIKGTSLFIMKSIPKNIQSKFKKSLVLLGAAAVKGAAGGVAFEETGKIGQIGDRSAEEIAKDIAKEAVGGAAIGAGLSGIGLAIGRREKMWTNMWNDYYRARRGSITEKQQQFRNEWAEHAKQNSTEVSKINNTYEVSIEKGEVEFTSAEKTKTKQKPSEEIIVEEPVTGEGAKPITAAIEGAEITSELPKGEIEVPRYAPAEYVKPEYQKGELGEKLVSQGNDTVTTFDLHATGAYGYKTTKINQDGSIMSPEAVNEPGKTIISYDGKKTLKNESDINAELTHSFTQIIDSKESYLDKVDAIFRGISNIQNFSESNYQKFLTILFDGIEGEMSFAEFNAALQNPKNKRALVEYITNGTPIPTDLPNANIVMKMGDNMKHYNSAILDTARKSGQAIQELDGWMLQNWDAELVGNVSREEFTNDVMNGIDLKKTIQRMFEDENYFNSLRKLDGRIKNIVKAVDSMRNQLWKATSITDVNLDGLKQYEKRLGDLERMLSPRKDISSLIQEVSESAQGVSVPKTGKQLSLPQEYKGLLEYVSLQRTEAKIRISQIEAHKNTIANIKERKADIFKSQKNLEKSIKAYGDASSELIKLIETTKAKIEQYQNMPEIPKATKRNLERDLRVKEQALKSIQAREKRSTERAADLLGSMNKTDQLLLDLQSKENRLKELLEKQKNNWKKDRKRKSDKALNKALNKEIKAANKEVKNAYKKLVQEDKISYDKEISLASQLEERQVKLKEKISKLEKDFATQKETTATGKELKGQREKARKELLKLKEKKKKLEKIVKEQDKKIGAYKKRLNKHAESFKKIKEKYKTEAKKLAAEREAKIAKMKDMNFNSLNPAFGTKEGGYSISKVNNILRKPFSAIKKDIDAVNKGRSWAKMSEQEQKEYVRKAIEGNVTDGKIAKKGIYDTIRDSYGIGSASSAKLHDNNRTLFLNTDGYLNLMEKYSKGGANILQNAVYSAKSMAESISMQSVLGSNGQKMIQDLLAHAAKTSVRSKNPEKRFYEFLYKKGIQNMSNYLYNSHGFVESILPTGLSKVLKTFENTITKAILTSTPIYNLIEEPLSMQFAGSFSKEGIPTFRKMVFNLLKNTIGGTVRAGKKLVGKKPKDKQYTQLLFERDLERSSVSQYINNLYPQSMRKGAEKLEGIFSSGVFGISEGMSHSNKFIMKGRFQESFGEAVAKKMAWKDLKGGRDILEKAGITEKDWIYMIENRSKFIADWSPLDAVESLMAGKKPMLSHIKAWFNPDDAYAQALSYKIGAAQQLFVSRGVVTARNLATASVMGDYGRKGGFFAGLINNTFGKFKGYTFSKYHNLLFDRTMKYQGDVKTRAARYFLTSYLIGASVQAARDVLKGEKRNPDKEGILRWNMNATLVHGDAIPVIGGMVSAILDVAASEKKISALEKAFNTSMTGRKGAGPAFSYVASMGINLVKLMNYAYERDNEKFYTTLRKMNPLAISIFSHQIANNIILDNLYAAVNPDAYNSFNEAIKDKRKYTDKIFTEWGKPGALTSQAEDVISPAEDAEEAEKRRQKNLEKKKRKRG